MKGSLNEQYDSDPEFRRMTEEESLIYEAQELVTSLMKSEGITRSELSDRLGVSRASVTQVLSGERNMTLRTLAAYLTCLGYRATLGVWPIVIEEGDSDV